MANPKITNFVDLLRFRGENQPDKVVYSFLEDGETESAHLTYQDLHKRAAAIAVSLRASSPAHCLQGERALLLYPPGLEFIAAFFGCLYAGVIAVPVYPPRRNLSLSRLQAIAQDSQATLALTNQKTLSDIERGWSQNPISAQLKWIATDNVAPDITASVNEAPFAATPETLAFLQYTSGSTGTPKGVMVSHSNLIHNCALIYQCFQNEAEHVGVSWLPFHHDMGLIGGLLESIYSGGSMVLMPPVAFLQKPLRWLQAISRYQAVTSGGPNFAYDLCCQTVKPQQLAELDLSSWDLAFSGAEPIRPETLARFTDTFAACGFRHRAFYPCYGMAETTLLVTGGIRSKEPVVLSVDRNALKQNQVVERSLLDSLSDSSSNSFSDSSFDSSSDSSSNQCKRLVGCGRSWLDQKVMIVDPVSLTLCEPNRIGEIWVAGGSVAQGYWQRPEQTRESFHAYLREPSSSNTLDKNSLDDNSLGNNSLDKNSLGDNYRGPFLRTGDLGCFRGEELFVTGRLKDVIIIRGRNYYPQDIELTVEDAHPALQANAGAAFSVEINATEQLVVVQEVTRTHLRNLEADEVIWAIRRAISEAHELSVYAVVLIKTASLPKTSSGKVQRQPCRERFLENELTVVAQWRRDSTDAPVSLVPERHFAEAIALLKPSEKVHAIETWLGDRISQQTQISVDEIDLYSPLASYGLDSLQVIALSTELEAWLGHSVSPTLVYDFPTIAALAQQLALGNPQRPHSQAIIQSDTSSTQPQWNRASDDKIAVIGMGCRFPGAPNLDAFWQLLHNGQDAITEVPLSRWDVDRTSSAEYTARWGGFLKQIEQFDPKFFGISPREAVSMDPQQRLLLEVCWETLENAGLAVDQLAGSSSGIFLGISNGEYARFQGKQIEPDAYYGTGNAFSVAANRLSYVLDWHGPSWAIDTACSSSLVAVHQACQSLRAGECTLALAGGVNVILTPQLTEIFAQAQMMAADGRCKTFDASADGYVRSEGCGAIALKRLADAERDGDTILGLIQGSAVNQDGRSNGLTAPNGLAQQQVIGQALSAAGVSATQIGYVEAHGTGTALGDPIEVNALKAVFSEARKDHLPCWLGSVKTNIGHLESAAGIAGLIKVLLSLQHQEIPPHLHLQAINPYIQIENTPLKIPTERQAWPVADNSGAAPRMAGVSSFGFGGTNAHVVVSEVPQLEQASAASQERLDFQERLDLPTRPLHVLTLTAKNDMAMRSLILKYQDHLKNNNHQPITDICFTANVGRSHFNHRAAIVADSRQQLIKQLKTLEEALSTEQPPASVFQGQCSLQKLPKVAYLFTGQGSQYVEMGRQLYETQSTFKQALDHCDEILRTELEKPLISVLYPEDKDQDATNLLDQTSLLDQTAYTQPALFAIEYALAELWRSWGVQPDIVLGHSVGEYAAACVAGVFSLEAGLKLIAARGRLMQSLPAGGEMLSLLATVEDVQRWIEPYQENVAIASINGPSSVVISGEGQAIASIAERLKAQGVKTKKLQVSHAFHSPLMEPMLAEFEALAQTIDYSPPQIPMVSCVTGKLIEHEIATPHYWVRHVRQPVRFAAGMAATLHQAGYRLFLEIGPKPLLLGMGKQCLSPEILSDTSPETRTLWLPSLRVGQSDWQQLLQSLSQLYINGVAIDWAGFDRDYSRRKVLLPNYPFQRQRYWIETDHHDVKASQAPSYSGALTDRLLNSDRKKIHPLIGPKLSLAIQSVLFHNQLSIHRPAYLTHHRVFGQALLPAAAYLEMALAAGKRVDSSRVGAFNRVMLSDVEIKRGLLLPEDEGNEGEVTVQTILTPLENGNYEFQISSLEQLSTDEKHSVDSHPTEPSWILHAQGKVKRLASEAPAPIDLDACKADFFQTIPISDYYQQLHEWGLEYGSDFQAIEQLWAAPNRALGKIVLPDSVTEAPAKVKDTYQLHPILLDASFQILAAAIGESNHQETYLPAGIKRLRLYGPVPNQLWAIGSISSPTTHASDQQQPITQKSGQKLYGDIQLVDSTGAVIAHAEGLSLVRTKREVLLRYLQPAVTPNLYEMVWEKSLPSSQPIPAASSGSGNWLLFLPPEDMGVGIGSLLVENLEKQGHHCVVVTVSENYHVLETDRYQLNPTNPEDFHQLLIDLSPQALPFQGVVHLWSTTEVGTDTGAISSSQDLDNTQSLSCASVLHLLQALTQSQSQKIRSSAQPPPALQQPTLWLITQGAQRVNGDLASLKIHQASLHQASLWGLGRVIALEQADLSCRLIDLAPHEQNWATNADDTVQQLVQELMAPDEEAQIAYRQGERFVARLKAYDAQAKETRLPIPPGHSFQLKLTEYGLLDNLALQAIERRSPGPHEVEIQVAAAGLNFRDVLNALGLLKDYYSEHLGITQASQLTFGFECAGTVVALGEAVSHLQVGDEVMATMLTDGVSRFVTTRAEFAIAKPKSMSFAQAATLPLAFLTAYYGLQHLANLQPGDRVLIHAAAGGVGQAAVQIAQQAGAEIFATASVSKWAFLKAQGIAHVMNSRTLDFADEIMQLTAGKGVDVVLNSLNGEFIDRSFDVLATGGRFVELGKIGIWDAQRVNQRRPDAHYYPFDLGEVTRANPQLTRELFEQLGEQFEQGQLKPLPHRTFPIQNSIAAFRYMQQAKHIGKVVLTLPAAVGQPSTSQQSLSIKRDRSYLITGGLGALGLEVAQWLARQGAGQLILNGRSAPSETAQQVIEQLQNNGVDVQVWLGDISQETEVARLFEMISTTLQPLKGVIHAAGCLDDGLLQQMSWDRFAKVMAPKVQGTWHLHQATQSLALDFFVCFSSLAALLGSPGQGNYAAANAFMDSLMRDRQAAGLPGLSINWGPWADVGMAATLNAAVQNRMIAHGIHPLGSKQALDRLGQLLKQSVAQIGVGSIDWPTFTAHLPTGQSLFVSLLTLRNTSENAATTLGSREKRRLQGLERLEAIPILERQAALMTHIRTEIAEVLGFSDPDEIALDQPLADLGVDSLMAVELANQLEQDLGPTIPASFLFEHPTLEELVRYLIEQMPTIEF